MKKKSNLLSNIILSSTLLLMVALILSVFKVDLVNDQSLVQVVLYVIFMFTTLYLSLNLIKILMRKYIGQGLIIFISIATSIALPIVLNNASLALFGYNGNLLGLILIYVITLYVYFESTLLLIKMRDY